MSVIQSKLNYAPLHINGAAFDLRTESRLCDHSLPALLLCLLARLDNLEHLLLRDTSDLW